MKRPPKLPYDQAAAVVQLEQIESRSQYFKWWDTWRPAGLPRRPNRTYAKVWKGWSHFLGTNNSFKNRIKKQYLSFEEAFLYAQQTKITTSTAWYDYGKHPSDIPVRPDIVYKGKFMGWKHFLQTSRKSVAEKVEMQIKLDELQVLLFAVPKGNASNQIHVSVHPTVAMAKKFLTKTQYQYVKAFKLDQGYDYQSVLAHHGTDYGMGEWLIGNVNQMLFDIDLDWVQ